MAAPDVNTVIDYLGDSSASPDEIASAFAAEQAAQAARCRVPLVGDWPADLVEALCIRVARNLDLRQYPLGLWADPNLEGAAATRIGMNPEIRRLEAPYRRLVVG